MIELFIWILVFVISLAVLIYSSDKFVFFAEDLGLLLKFSPFVIGVVLVSIGTSLPELISSIIAVLKGYSEIVFGNAAGSNIANIFLVLGIAGIVAKKAVFKNDYLRRDIIYMLLATIVGIIVSVDGMISVVDGMILGVVLLWYIYLQTTSGGVIEKHKVSKTKLQLSGLLVLTALGVFVGAKFTVDSAIELGYMLGISKDVISASAIALGTSLPELFVSVAAARKGKMELAVGNVLGSNAFNMLGVIGIPALLGGLVVASTSLLLLIPALVVSSILFTLVISDKKIKKYEGVLLLFLYIVFLGFLFF